MRTTTLSKRSVFTPQLHKRMLIGAGIGLAAVGFFVLMAGKGNPAWGDYWRIKPLLLTPALGSVTGLCYDATEPLRKIKGWLSKVFLVLSALGFLAGQWLGLVLGLAGTMWH